MFIVSLCVAVLAFPLVNVSSSILASTDQFCPPTELIKPCICYKDSQSNHVILQCGGFTNEVNLRQIFGRIKGFKFQDLVIENSYMDYIPTSIFDHVVFEQLNISAVTLFTLFDEPLKSYKININLIAASILRGIDWSLLTSWNPVDFFVFNGDIRKLGQSFRDHMSKTVQHLLFHNTKTHEIADDAFVNLKYLTIMGLPHNQIKRIKRSMFARPAGFFGIDFSFNSISSLPDDIFDDMPDLTIVNFESNQLTTISERIFSKHPVWYGVMGNPIDCDCSIKWTTTEVNKYPNLLAGSCSKPNILKGRKIEHFKKEDFTYCED